MMSHFDLPLRNRKDLAHAVQLRSLALARPILPSTAYENNTHAPPSRHIKATRNIMTTNLPKNPYYLNAFLDPYLTSDQPPSPANNNNAYPTEIHLLNNLSPKPYYNPTSTPSSYHHTNTSPSSPTFPYPRRSNTPRTTPRHNSPPPLCRSSPKAARTLSTTLSNASRQFERLESSFAAETRYLVYADEKVLALLWRAKVGFCGWLRLRRWDDEDGEGEEGREDYDEEEEEYDDGEDGGFGARDSGGVSAGDESLFAVCAGRLLDAIEDFRGAGRAWGRGDGASGGAGGIGEKATSGGVGIIDVRLTMKKLIVSFGALEGFLEGVRVEKSRCDVLVRELRSAQDVLFGIRRVWELPPRSGGKRRDGFSGAVPAGGGKIPVAVSVEDWENSSYRSE